ncbi:uncharacterized protein LOC129616285, partial [Condylostylus longicornis]|uniref:uncharacterized protein LOC129616285 n=1 Tax=Condylostylus longicornis TaxID=2530218 RepID=UPI00244E19C1
MLKNRFETKDLGEVENIVGFDKKRESSKGNIEISQKNYINTILQKFNCLEANSVCTPLENNIKLLQIEEPITTEENNYMEKRPYQELIGALSYLSNSTRPDISFSVNYLARYNNSPRKVHWKAAKRILKYLIAFSDSDWANDIHTRKSCSGYVVTMCGGPISWKSQKQKSTALSTME